MADYYPLLKRAVASLPDNNPESRNAIFLRARTALTSQLRSVDPPLSEGDIARESLALDEVIRRIEDEEREAAAQRQATSQWEGMSQRDDSLRWAAPAPDVAHRTADDEPAGPPIARDEAFIDEPQAPDEPGEAEGAPLSGGRRPRLEPVRRRGEGQGLRRAMVFGILGLLIAAIAGLAYWVNKINQPEVPTLAQSPAAPPANAERKFNERVGGEQPPPAAAEPPAPNQPSAPAPAPRPGTPGQPAIGVAQRAILYEESPDNPQTPRALVGRVVWRLDTINPGQGQSLETVVRANIDVPEAGLSLGIVFRRNTDPVLPASHTMEMTFSKTAEGTPGGEGRVIRDIGVPQFKVDESARGAPLSGLPVPVTDTFFLIGLSNVATDIDRNLELIKTRNWIDIPIRYVNGRRAVLAFEKGVSGDQAIAAALKAWQ
jgi:hypothetical protein